MEPIKVTLVKGRRYFWAQKQGQALLDWPGEKGHGRQFTADRTEAYICTCKKSKSAPYCDGSHKTAKDE